MTPYAASTPLAARAATSDGYVPLGAFRLLLALLVLLQHAAAQIGTAGIAGVIGPFEPGSIAVYVFFVLSGFIIADAVALTYRDRPFAFLANRAMRIVPSYVVALVVFAVIAAIAFRAGFGPLDTDGPVLRPEDLASPRVFLGNLLAVLPLVPESLLGEPVPLMIPIVWAVRVELLFYGVFFAALLVSRLAGLPLGRVLAALGTIALAAAGLAFDASAGTAAADAPFFVLGVAAHRLLTRDPGPDAATLAAGALAMGALALCLVRLAALDPVVAGTLHLRAHAVEIGLFIGLLTLFANLALVRLPARGVVARADRRFGELTYPLYLNHMAVVSLAAAATVAPTPALFLLAMALAIGFSWLVAAPTEPVIARLRDRIRGRRLD
jgi:peptidoglycan/LPS O-acetylase OafA/YrhL